MRSSGSSHHRDSGRNLFSVDSDDGDEILALTTVDQTPLASEREHSNEDNHDGDDSTYYTENVPTLQTAGISPSVSNPPLPIENPAYGVVLHSYESQEEDELSVEAGTEFVLCQTFDDDWWMIETLPKKEDKKEHPQRGMVPANFVQLHDPSLLDSYRAFQEWQNQAVITPRIEALHQTVSHSMDQNDMMVATHSLTIHTPPRTGEKLDKKLLDDEYSMDVIPPFSPMPDDGGTQTPITEKEAAELRRLQHLREEATMRLDELRTTVETHESSLNHPQQVRRPSNEKPQKNSSVSSHRVVKNSTNSSKPSKLPISNATSSDTTVSQSDSRPRRNTTEGVKVMEEEDDAGAVARVVLDKSSVMYISKIVNEKIQREFTSRDRRLLRHVEEMVESTIGRLTRDPSSSGLASLSIPADSALLTGGNESRGDRLPSLSPPQNMGSEMDSRNGDNANYRSNSKIPRFRLPRIGSGANTPSKPSTHPESDIPSKGSFRSSNSSRGTPQAAKSVREEWLATEGVQYPQCRSVVFPSTEDSSLAQRQARSGLPPQPDASLVLRAIHGYDGDPNHYGGAIRSHNIIWLSGGKRIAYPAAAVVVVMDTESEVQSFFTAHTEDVTCLTLHPHSPLIASAQKGMPSLIWVWNHTSVALGAVATRTEIASPIRLPPSARGISSLSFSGDGKLLCAATLEDSRSVCIFDWRRGALISQCRLGHADIAASIGFHPFAFSSFNEAPLTAAFGAIPAIGGSTPVRGESATSFTSPTGKRNIAAMAATAASPRGCHCLVSYGGRQVKFWTLRPQLPTGVGALGAALANGGGAGQTTMNYVLEGCQATAGRRGGGAEYTCVAYLNNDNGSDARVFLGTASGAVHVWMQLEAVSSVESHSDKTDKIWQPRGRLLLVITDLHESPLVSLQVWNNHRSQSSKKPEASRLVSADANGVLSVWSIGDVSGETSKGVPLEQLTAVALEESCARAMAWCDTGDELVVGTANNSIYYLRFDEAESSSKVADVPPGWLSVIQRALMHGHNGKVRRLGVHPLHDFIFVSAGSDRWLRLWSTISNRQLSAVELDIAPTAVTFSADGKMLVAGTDRGELLFLRSESFSTFVEHPHDDKQESDAEMNDWQMVETKSIAPSTPSATPGKSNSGTRRHGVTELRFSPSGQLLAVGSRDSAVHLLSATNSTYRQVGVCRGHTSQIRNIDFSRDGRLLRSSDSARELLFWEVATASRLTNAALYREANWATSSVGYGWALQGVFNRWIGDRFVSADGDINAVARSVDGTLLAAAGTHTSVKLFRYPALPDAQPTLYSGHTAPVADLAFLHSIPGIASTLSTHREDEEAGAGSDDLVSTVLATAGGNDATIFIWAVQRHGDSHVI